MSKVVLYFDGARIWFQWGMTVYDWAIQDAAIAIEAAAKRGPDEIHFEEVNVA